MNSKRKDIGFALLAVADSAYRYNAKQHLHHRAVLFKYTVDNENAAKSPCSDGPMSRV